ncbi:allantoate amidohydrolase [Microbacterium sp. SSM24]|uniref:allantoate amidohydrolase n=1 Tax=Microbacterium sp. SSM24 TaxID=2991714 RepID=UPI0022266045|nr:allantoate amidohydrolase [Microbacterium sp. SSM24]MCW3493369.1 allantoate amidohydrolase [Microbacterium sp. SSM24]
MSNSIRDGFDRMWAELEPIGRDAQSRGYRRYAWSDADMDCRAWFQVNARRRGLDVETDGNGNLWAWWGDPDAGDALAVGSHLDSVPDGGGFDGPLGVVSAFSAIDALQASGVTPARPVAVVAFADEEGARFGVACAGSRLLTGQLSRERALSLTDVHGVSMEQAMRSVGHDPSRVGSDPARVARLGAFIELHVEQGRVPIAAPDGSVVHGLHGCGAPIGIGTSIQPHGRWRFDLSGRADHAGTTALVDRDDPTLRLADLVLAARESAAAAGAVATVGRIEVVPNGVNAIPSLVRAWLDVRAEDDERVRQVVSDAEAATGTSAQEESWTPGISFEKDLTDRLSAALAPRFGDLPLLTTAAGHDAGILSNAGVPTAMVFVRNQTGTSHSPLEFVDRRDRHAGVFALADVLSELC